MQHLCFHKVPNYPLASYIFGGYKLGVHYFKKGYKFKFTPFFKQIPTAEICIFSCYGQAN